MEQTVIRGEVQAFLQVCHGFAGFVQNNRLTTAEHEALAHVSHMLGVESKPPPVERP